MAITVYNVKVICVKRYITTESIGQLSKMKGIKSGGVNFSLQKGFISAASKYIMHINLDVNNLPG